MSSMHYRKNVLPRSFGRLVFFLAERSKHRSLNWGVCVMRESLSHRKMQLRSAGRRASGSAIWVRGALDVNEKIAIIKHVRHIESRLQIVEYRLKVIEP